MDCARCGGELEAMVERGVEIDRCAPCRVVFFDAGELDRYADGAVEAALHRVRDEGVEADARCPRCDGPMRTIRTGSGGIDACTLCAGLRVTWTERPPLLDLRPLPKRESERVSGIDAGGSDLGAELMLRSLPHLELPDLDGEGAAGLVEGAGGLLEGAGGLAEGAGELLGGLLGAIGEILGGAS